MKRNLQLILFLFIFQLSAFSQFDKGKFYIDANYRYNNSNQLSNGLGDKKIKSVLSPNVGYFVLDNFVVGVGFNLDYAKSSTTIQGMQMQSMDGVVLQDEHIINSSITNVFLPSVFVKYIYPFSSKLSVSLMLRSMSGQVKEDVSIQTINVVGGSANSTTFKSATGNFTSIAFSPEIRYFITKNIGLQINTNGYVISSFPAGNSMFNYTRFGGYVLKNPITYDKSAKIEISPSNWSFGAFVVL